MAVFTTTVLVLGAVAVAGGAVGFAADRTTKLARVAVVGGALYLLFKVLKR